ncbi:hypothetical protein GCK72_002655 [Caenorhabditis remanei]|uniref:F-box associated domain-containing protein n=1 Tax=Caenorhabditis remanei TaxID=31234 RepID=A0A6A5HUJ4_CAERE|nr:hypothetical protein GCK72_002655 [Caenorhabditis remanei]KAF1770831.1 hypothetical protein GCK72_002655 [Caenorhabditis remanei]
MISINTGDDDLKPVVSFSSEDLILIRAVRDGIEVIPINVFGISSFCCMRSGYFEIMANESNIQTLLLSFYNYVHEFLGPSPEYQLSVEPEGFLPKIKNVNVTKLHFRQCPRANVLEEYFSCSPNQECVFFKTWAQFEFMTQSKICDTNNLKFDCLGQPTDQILADFNGRSLVLELTSIKESTIIEFVNQWRSNRKYQNLEFVHINLFRESYEDPLELMEEIGVKENGLAVYHFKNRSESWDYLI